MTDEPTPQLVPNLAELPSVESLAKSEDAALVSARAELLEAQAKLKKVSQPLFDKIVLRGVIPFALAVVGPWALWKFDKAQIEAKVEQTKQGEVIVDLQQLLGDSKEEAASRQRQSSVWRKRMKKIEEAKAVELLAMGAMVIRLDDTLKTALVQMTVARLVHQDEAQPKGTARSKKALLNAATQQLKLPGLDEKSFRKIGSDQYDRIQKAKKLHRDGQ